MKVIDWRWMASYSAARHAQRRFRIHAREGIERIVHQILHHATEVLDLAVLVDRAFLRGEPRGDVADLLALIAHPFEVGDGLDDGDDEPQVAGCRRARGEDARTLLVDRDLHVVDMEVVVRDRFTERAVALDERRDRLGELLLDEAAHGEDLVADAVQVFVEPARDVWRKIGGIHGDEPPGLQAPTPSA
jgi:hypothetical protein